MEGQGARAGSLYIALSLGGAGVMTYLFLGLIARSLSLNEYGAIATLWSATLLFAPLLWIGTTQALGRHVAEREARGEDWRPVVEAVWRAMILLLLCFAVVILLIAPWITRGFFGGRYFLTAAFAVAILCHAFAFFRRGLLSGRRQLSRVGLSYLSESAFRVCVTVALLLVGFGAAAPAMGIALAPLASVFLVHLKSGGEPEKLGGPFHILSATSFMVPVLVSMACAQALANGGALLISGMGGPDANAKAGLLVAALTLARAPQSVLGPAVSNLLPHLSRLVMLGDKRQMNIFVWQAVAVVGCVGLLLIGGMWLLGEPAMKLVYGPQLGAERETLTVLAVLAAALLLCELLNQVLFAKGLAWLAATSWVLGLLGSVGLLLLLQSEILTRVSYALALGSVVTAAIQIVFITRLRHRPRSAPPVIDQKTRS